MGTSQSTLNEQLEDGGQQGDRVWDQSSAQENPEDSCQVYRTAWSPAAQLPDTVLSPLGGAEASK